MSGPLPAPHFPRLGGGRTACCGDDLLWVACYQAHLEETDGRQARQPAAVRELPPPQVVVMICEMPVQRGPRKGLPATGTEAGYYRHRRAREQACPECLAATSARSGAWNNTHPGSRRQSSLKWRAANRDYQSPDPEVGRARSRRWHAANKEYAATQFAEWRKSNLGVMAEHERKRRARKQSVLTLEFTAKELADKMGFWGNRCWMCHGPFEAVDHVKPIAKGGPHILANLRPTCRACNTAKHARWPLAEVLRVVERRSAA